MTHLDYFIMRRQKKIKLRQIADYCNCSISALSRFENGQLNNFNSHKVQKYQEFIKNYNDRS